MLHNTNHLIPIKILWPSCSFVVSSSWHFVLALAVAAACVGAGLLVTVLVAEDDASLLAGLPLQLPCPRLLQSFRISLLLRERRHIVHSGYEVGELLHLLHGRQVLHVHRLVVFANVALESSLSKLFVDVCYDRIGLEMPRLRIRQCLVKWLPRIIILGVQVAVEVYEDLDDVREIEVAGPEQRRPPDFIAIADQGRILLDHVETLEHLIPLQSFKELYAPWLLMWLLLQALDHLLLPPPLFSRLPCRYLPPQSDHASLHRFFGALGGLLLLCDLSLVQVLPEGADVLGGERREVLHEDTKLWEGLNLRPRQVDVELRSKPIQKVANILVLWQYHVFVLCLRLLDDVLDLLFAKTLPPCLALAL